ncbi:hypothetical protein ACWF94_07210 [Streptomyces sp. NPDC055078]
MTEGRVIRWVKGTVVAACAAGICYWLWTSAREWAAHASDADSSAFLSGALESGVATIAGVAAMPVLLWAGMRALGERGNHVVIIAGAVMWLFVGGHVVENDVGEVGTAAFLALFTVLGGLAALAEVPEN